MKNKKLFVFVVLCFISVFYFIIGTVKYLIAKDALKHNDDTVSCNYIEYVRLYIMCKKENIDFNYAMSMYWSDIKRLVFYDNMYGKGKRGTR